MSRILTEADTRSVTRVGQLWIVDFRCFGDLHVVPAPGVTLLRGANGQGKTSVLEAIGWVARRRSFRGTSDAMLVRSGCPIAVVRAEVQTAERRQLFEAELRVTGRNRVRCNMQPVVRARDLHSLLHVTVFAPDDLALVKDGPSARRLYLDELLAMLAVRYETVRADFERALKQRNALLRAGVRDQAARATLDVFDEQLVRSAAEVLRERLRLSARLGETVAAAYESFSSESFSSGPRRVCARYEVDWAAEPLTEADADAVEDRLRDALVARRRAEIERGLTLVGPHRDEWRLWIGDLDARVQASQGEQRTLALALRLAGHAVVTELTGTAPVVLLDDVFSELDAQRAAALVRNLPDAQTLLTTAGTLPDGVVAERELRVHAGAVEEL